MNSSTDSLCTLLRAAAWLVLMAGLLTACTTAPTVKTTQTPQAEAIPETAKQRFQEALTLMHAGKAAAAEAVLRELTRDYPKLAGPYVNLGILHRRAGRLQEAEQALRQALALRADHAAAHNELGIVYREQGRFAEAEQAYRAALAADPDYALAHLNLGILLDIYLQRPAEALLHYRAYQKLQQETDKQVALWIIDLERRLQEEAEQP